MRTLLIDPSTGGIAGDTLSAALCDLTGSREPLAAVADAIRRLPRCASFEVNFGRVTTPCSATRISVTLVEEDRPSPDLPRELESVAAGASISPRVAETARAVLDDILSVSGRFPTGTPDGRAITSLWTLFEILAPLALLEACGLLDVPITATPPALGGGMATTPGALEICARHGLPVADSPAAPDLTTPVGAALLANLASTVAKFPAMVPLRVGYGTRTGNTDACGRILRVIEGVTGDLAEERIIILETTIDDVDGETIGFARERLFSAGAVDVSVIPALGKKNRPAHILSVITTREDYLPLVRILMEETGTLGVRIREEPRIVAERTRERVDVTVCGRLFSIRVKTSRAGGRVISVKAEYEDLKGIALSLRIPLRQVAREVYRQLPPAGIGPGKDTPPS
ncbi:MAG: LarC family nickel insertion protein [Methanolinea sp.]